MKSIWTALPVLMSLVILSACKDDKVEAKPAPKPAPVQIQEEPEMISLEDALNEESSMPSNSKTNVKESEQVHSLTNSNYIPEIKSSGDYILQVSTSTYKKDADAMIKKIKGLGYDAYAVEVENPAELQGNFIRVRLGYFSNLTDARQFGHNVLKPAGISFWIDNSANDYIVGTSQSSVYEEPVSKPEPVKAKEPVAKEIVQDEWDTPAPAVAEPKPAPVVKEVKPVVEKVVSAPAVQKAAPVVEKAKETKAAAKAGEDFWGTPESTGKPKVVAPIKKEVEAATDSWEATVPEEKAKAWSDEQGWD